jgi:hypothetical protein
VLDEHADRLAELECQGQRRIGVEDVVVAEFLAAQLPRVGEARRRLADAVEGRLLVRVLAVPEVLQLLAGERDARREERLAGLRPPLAVEPLRDRRVVARRVCERLRRQLAQQVDRQRAAVVAQRAQHRAVVTGVADHGDALVVLGGTAQHRRTADVDVLDDVGARRTGLPHRLAEAVEVDAQHVDRVDAVLDHRRAVAGVVAATEQPAVHLRMQGLEPPVHQLGEARVVGDLGRVDVGVEQGAPRAAGRQQAEPQLLQPTRELDDALLVGDREQRASHFLSSFRCFRYPSMNGSRSPSSTPCTSEVSTSVRRSLHIW